MANYNVDIAVALKGAKKLTAFNKDVRTTQLQVEGLNKSLKNVAKDQGLLVRSFDNLNQVLSQATKNFNAAATGSQQQFAAARQLVSIEKELNKEYQERERVLQSITLKGQRSSIVPGQSLFGQSVTPKGGASGRSRKILAENQELQAALGSMEQRAFGKFKFLPPIQGITESQLALKTRVSSNIAESQRIREIVAAGSSREKLGGGFKEFNKHAKKIQADTKKISTIVAQNQARGIQAFGNQAYSKPIGPVRPGILGRLGIGTGANPRGMFANPRGRAGRISGGLQSGLIGGGFPLLFGQGGAGAIAGGIGGALGGALSPGFGFAGSIAATAITQQIQQTLEFRKSIRDLNKEMEQMGISSNISGSQVRQLGKSLGITKEEAVKALQEFKRFGNQAVLFAEKFGGDFAKFDAIAQANTVQSALEAIRKINEDLTLDDELRFINSVRRLGVEETINQMLDEMLEKEKKLKTEGFGQGEGKNNRANRKRLGQLRQESVATQELVDKNRDFIEGLTKVRDQFTQNRDAAEAANRGITKGLEDVNAELRKLNDVQFQVVELSKTLGSAFSESFKGIIKGTMSVGDAFRNMFMRIADHFLDMAAQMMAAQISRGFMGLFANAFGGGIGGGGVNLDEMSQFVNTGGPTMADFGGGLASGGMTKGGKSYLVGERGPELFTPGVSGMVTPNHALGGLTNIVVNVDASGSSVEGDEEQGRELGRMISVAIQSELIKQKRPGGLLT